MTNGSQRESRCWNSWRPSDGPLRLEAVEFRRQQSPFPLERTERTSTTQTLHPRTRQDANFDQRLAPMSTQTTPVPPARAFRNPNLMPMVPRRSYRETSSSLLGDFRQVEEADEERLPQIWHPSIDDLIRRTAHDYDLIMNYQRDAEGGQRWLPRDTSRIRAIGKNLHRDVFSLRRWQRIVAQQGDQDKATMEQIKRDVNLLKLQCERIQQAIIKYEQKCEFELLRDGIYAQDEEGNFYKPTTPQRYVTESGYLQDVPQPSIESMRDDNRGSPQAHNQNAYQGYSSTARSRTPLDTEPSSPPKRSEIFDPAFQSASWDREAINRKLEATHQSTTSRSSRVSNNRVSKLHQRSSHGNSTLQTTALI